MQVTDFLQTAEFDFNGPALVVQVRDTVDVAGLKVAPEKLVRFRGPSTNPRLVNTAWSLSLRL